jgi:hypothetical protein
MKTKTTIETSNVKIGDVQIVEPKTAVVESMPRRVSSETIGKEIASRITGKLIGFDDLFDAKTKTFLLNCVIIFFIYLSPLTTLACL